jgi:hypothetical protein
VGVLAVARDDRNAPLQDAIPAAVGCIRGVEARISRSERSNSSDVANVLQAGV